MKQPEGEGLVFDVDGVLIDTSRSFFRVVSSAVDIYLSRFLSVDLPEKIFAFEHYRRAKMNPMFNDDYDIAWFFLCWVASTSAILCGEKHPDQDDWGNVLHSCLEDPAVSGESIFKKTADRTTVRKICEELYFGHDLYRLHSGLVPEFTASLGAWNDERPIINRKWDCFGRPVGIYTGRSAAEMTLALRVLGWNGFPEEFCVTSADGIKKPSPDGLFILERLMGVSELFFFGDTESDREAFARYGRGRFFPIGEVLSDCPGWFPTVNEALAAIGL